MGKHCECGYYFEFKFLIIKTLVSLVYFTIHSVGHKIHTTHYKFTYRSITKKSDVELYFKIDKFTKQRILLSVTTVACDIYDALELIKDIKSRKGFELLLKVRNVEILII